MWYILGKLLILLVNLCFCKIRVEWAPTELTEVYKCNLLDNFSSFTRLLQRWKWKYLEIIVRSHETGTNQFEPESKIQIMVKKQAESLAIKKFQSQASAEKEMLIVLMTQTSLWGCINGNDSPQPPGPIYSEILANELKPRMHSKDWGPWSNLAVLLPANRHQHTPVHSVQTNANMSFLLLENLKHTLDLTSLNRTIIFYKIVYLLRTETWRKLCLNGQQATKIPSLME